MELHGDEVDDRSGSWTALLHAGDHALEDRLFFFVNSAACKIIDGQESRATHTHTRECSKYLSEVETLSLVVRERERPEGCHYRSFDD